MKSCLTLLQKLGSVVDSQDRLEICKRLVDRFLPAARKFATAIDVGAVCKSMRIPVDYRYDVPFEGRLIRNHEYMPQITLRMGGNQDRLRFTLAHELGHLIVQEALQERRESLFRGVPTTCEEERQEELLADALAAEILLPMDRFRAEVGDTLSEDVITGAINRFAVSRLAIVRRFAEINKCRVLSISALPTKLNDESTKCFIDDVWIADSRGGLHRDRNAVKFTENRNIRDLCETSKTGVEIEFAGARYSVCFVSWLRFGMFPRLRMIGRIHDEIQE